MVESLSLKGFKDMQMLVALGAWISSGLNSVGLVVGLDLEECFPT